MQSRNYLQALEIGITAGFLLFSTPANAAPSTQAGGANPSVSHADKLLKGGKISDAIKAYSQIIKANPSNSLAYFRRARAYQQSKNYTYAVADLDKFLKLQPTSSSAHAFRAVILQTINKPDLAGIDWSKAIELSHGGDNSYYYGRALAFYQINSFSKALADLSKFLEVNAERTPETENRATILKASCLFELKRYREAIELYDVVIKNNPSLAEAFCNRGVSYQKLGQKKNALEDFSKAVKLNAQDKSSLYNYGLALQEMGDGITAIEQFSKVIALEPNNEDAIFHRGQCHLNLQQTRKACDDFSAIIALPNAKAKAAAYLVRGVIYLNLKEQAKAIQDFSATIDLTPSDTKPYFYRGMAHYELKQMDEAISDLTKADHGDSPRSVDLYAARGSAWFSKNNYQKAADDFTTVIKRSPNLPGIYESRALAYEKLGDHDLARADRTTARELKK